MNPHDCIPRLTMPMERVNVGVNLLTDTHHVRFLAKQLAANKRTKAVAMRLPTISMKC